jgi:hypothetical protein
MIRPAPPAPFKTALVTFLIAATIALLIAHGASAIPVGPPYEAKVTQTRDSGLTGRMVHR